MQKLSFSIAHFESPDERGIDVALLYNPTVFELVQSKSLTVPINIPTRDVLWVSGNLDGELLHIFINHWRSRSGGEARSSPLRQAAAQVNKAVIDSLLKADVNANILVMGDLNDDPISPSVKKILATGNKADNLKPNQLYNPYYKLYKRGIGSLAWRDSWNLFDQIIIFPSLANSKPAGFYLHQAEVFNKSFLAKKSGNFKGYPWRSYVGSTYMGATAIIFRYLFRLKPYLF